MSAGSKDRILECLQFGVINVEGQFMWGSNHTLLVQVELDKQTLKAVYKPVHGERPLWDFPSDSLAGREAAAYIVSEAIGWNFVPPTVYRQDGPTGAGSLQLFVEHDPDYHYFNFRPEDRQRLRQVALFDALVNNTDRKGGHILIDPEGEMWLIDHGISFHQEPKLRTVIWDFAGNLIKGDNCEDLKAFSQLLEPETTLVKKLETYLTTQEIQALRTRNDQLISKGQFPLPISKERSHPWPPI